jgi:DNA polymerase-3 subunit delta
VLIENKFLAGSHPILKLAEKFGGQVSKLTGPDKSNLPTWIIARAKTHGATIEPGAAQLLGQRIGLEVRTLDSELEKLALYVAGQRPIQRADVELLTPDVEEADDFGLSNAIGQRNARRAYDQLHKELEEKHPMVILSSIATQIRNLIEVKDLAERGMSPAEIAKAKGWRSEYAATARLKDAANFSMDRLEQTLETLLEIDVAIKTGRVESLLALDMLIARLCAR